MIVKLQGGLGNQMFQYAFAKNLEISSGQKVSFDTSFSQVSSETKRYFALNDYIASDSIIPADLDILPFVFRHPPGDFLKKAFNSLLKKGWLNGKWRYVNEEDYLLSTTRDRSHQLTYFDGFWQSENFFLNIRSSLLTDFSLKNPGERFKTRCSEMNSSNSVGVHVRRGDYITDMATGAYHGICSPLYYQQAIELIQSIIADPRFFIFTDDPDWAREYFTNSGLTFELISGQGFKDSEELLIMASCCNQIIANSSFSWWGAWLNQNKYKTVIAPFKWFSDPKKNSQNDSLIPQNWVKL
jgi:hypothetical protein